MSASRNRILQLLANNEKYANSFTGAPKMEELRAWGKAKDGVPLIVLTCVDPRCVPEAFFGPLLRGAVYRNAGGRATDDVVRSLNILRALVHLRIVVVVHHTDCGVSHVTDDEIRDFAKSKNPAAAADVDKIDFRLWQEEHLEETVREDVRKLREEKSLDGMEIYGFVLDTQTAVVKEVVG